MSASTSVHSNAFNFQSYVQHGVDPRTGQYTVSLSVPELKSDALAGPPLQLGIAYNPMNTRDGGFGLGWGINLTEYNPRTNILSLSTGETFKVTGSGETPDIAERKLETFHFHNDGNGLYRVVHRSGLVEVLQLGGGSTNQLALPLRVLAPDGRGLHFTYATFQGGQRLSTVRDDNGELLLVERNDISNQVHLQLYPGRGVDGKPLARFVLHLDGLSRVTRIALPTDDNACWRLAYRQIRAITCLIDVWTPTGAHETMEYDDEGHAFPAEAHPALPRVTRHTVHPGMEQPAMDVHYDYSKENFLGHRALSSWSDDGLDNLYRIGDPHFRYSSTAALWGEGKAQRTVERRYNRFHLMTDEITIQGNCRKHAKTTYYADHPDHIDSSFDEQPAQCQLPWSEETFWELTDNPNLRRLSRSDTRFDRYGNLTERINADGTREVNEYYGVDGEDGLCPPDPEQFVRSLKSRTAFPAPSPHGSAPTLRTELEYIALPSLPGGQHKPFLVEQRQILSEVGGDELKRVHTEYFDDPSDPLLFGRTRSVSETLNGLATFTDYAYQLGRGASLSEDTLTITETLTGFDGATQSISQQLSLINGQPLMVRDLSGVEARFTYDALGRVLSEIISPGTDYHAIRTYAYHLISGDNEGPAWQELTDVHGVKTRTRFDGLSRPIHEEQQDTDAARANGQPPEQARFRQTYQAWHDALGQRVRERVIDWLGTRDLALDTRYTYDNWGERLRVTQPDGVSEVTEVSPFGTNGPVERRWLESADTPPLASDLRVSWYNAFGKIDRIEHLDGDQIVFTLEQDHDGLGQCVRSTEIYDGQDVSTHYTFDPFRRVDSLRLPDQTLLSHHFAAHSEEALPVCIRVKPANAALPEIIAGEQGFDGLDRLVHRTVAGRREAFLYEGGAEQPFHRTTPAGNQIQFDYVRALGDAARAVIAPDDSVTYEYAPRSGSLTGASNAQGTRSYEYADTGEVTLERWTTPVGEEHASQYQVSRLGRQLLRTDSGSGASPYSSTTTCHYDDHGRLRATEQGALRCDIVYDSMGRPGTTTTHNLLTRQTLVSELQYDTFGRETLRTLRVGATTFTVTQHWRADDELARRELHANARPLLDETFHYDRRGRLQRHVCEGEQCPQDRFGNTITQQVFTYDAMDNIIRCITNLQDKEPVVADYTYSEADPCQLIQICRRHDDYPDTEQFAYDDDGNLINDHQGRELRYDSLGRLLSLAIGADATAYHYDGHGELVESVDAGNSTLRFYQGFQLNHAVRGDHSVHLLYADGEPLGEQTSRSGPARLLLATTIGSIIGETQEEGVRTAAYTAYGETAAGLASLLGFHGEVRDAGGWYLLGRGYRAYCPALMRFNRPDSESPFGRGGLNPYVYCQGNPIAFRDRSGHRRELPEYKYPPPPVEQPSSGGGWLKWLGVAISGIFLVASVVAAPWSLGMSAPVMVAAVKGMAMQVAAIGMQVVGTLSNDPTLQMVMMVGSMGLGIYGGMATAKANAAGKLLIKQQKAGAAPLFNAGVGASDEVFKIPRPHVTAPSGAQGMRGVARPGDTAAGTMPAALSTPRAGKLPAPQNHLPRVRLPARRYPLAIKKHADMFTGKPLEGSFFWIQRGVRGSPYVAGMRNYR